MKQNIKAFALDACSYLESSISLLHLEVEEARESSRNMILGDNEGVRTRVTHVAEAVRSEAAKIGFLFSQEKTPERDEAKSLLSGLRNSTALFCSVISSVVAGGGCTLKRVTYETVKNLVDAVCELMKAAAEMFDSEEDLEFQRRRITKLAGVCVACCEVAKKAPLDDKLAIGRALSLVARQLADAAAEVNEEIDSQDDQPVSVDNKLFMCNLLAQDKTFHEQQVILDGINSWMTEAQVQGAALVPCPATRATQNLVIVCSNTLETFKNEFFSQLLKVKGFFVDVRSSKATTSSRVALLIIRYIIIMATELIRSTIRELMALESGQEMTTIWENILKTARDLTCAVDDLVVLGYDDDLDSEALSEAGTSIVQACDFINQTANAADSTNSYQQVNTGISCLQSLLQLINNGC